MAGDSDDDPGNNAPRSYYAPCTYYALISNCDHAKPRLVADLGP